MTSSNLRFMPTASSLSPAATGPLPQTAGRLRVALNRSFAQAAARHGLSVQQAELLCGALAPTSVGSLAATLGCDRSNVTRLADRAADRGLLTRARAGDDGRVTLVQLTPQGERLARDFLDDLSARLARLERAWPAQRRSEAIAVLGEIAEELER
jgi:DNA-binding MarR family transcriptional regulator